MKDETNKLGAEIGFSQIDFRKKAEHRRDSHTDSRTRETLERISGYDGQPTAERSIGEIQREMQRIDERAK